MKNKNTFLILLLLLALYFLFKKFIVSVKKNNPEDLGEPDTPNDEITHTDTVFPDRPIQNSTARSRGCVDPRFPRHGEISGRSCAGERINENRMLRLGDVGCDVLLLQQRLNSIETELDILKPNGEFCCKTQDKLLRLMSVPEITLNSFSPDEQIGFNELQGGTQLTPYSYMDVRTFNK